WLPVPFRTAHHAQRPIRNMWQHVIRNGHVILSELLFGQTALFIENLIGMTYRKVHHAPAILPLSCSSHPRRFRRGACAPRGNLGTNLPFTHHFASRLILAQALERRLPHKIVSRPRGKCNLSNQLGLYPNRAPPCIARHAVERRFSLNDRIQTAAQCPVSLFGKPRSRPARIAQLFAIVVPQQERPNTDTTRG